MLERLWKSTWFQPFVLIIIAIILILIVLRLAMASVRSDINIINKDQKKLYSYIVTRDSIQDVKDSVQDERLAHFPELPLSIDDMSRVSSVFNVRQDPKTGEREFHTGIDYRAKRGSIVYAAATGIVKEARYDVGYGNTIRIDHLNGYVTTYAHLSNLTVIEGEEVTKGDTIGNVGSTGYTTGSHLHYEIAFQDRKINPDIFTQTATR
jgi:murein DD-endopeptidase MepM/ murein hydrolase activator NlpD